MNFSTGRKRSSMICMDYVVMLHAARSLAESVWLEIILVGLQLVLNEIYFIPAIWNTFCLSTLASLIILLSDRLRRLKFYLLLVIVSYPHFSYRYPSITSYSTWSSLWKLFQSSNFCFFSIFFPMLSLFLPELKNCYERHFYFCFNQPSPVHIMP